MSAAHWYASEHPERPTDALTWWHYEGCTGCVVKADALSRQFPDHPHWQELQRAMRAAK